MPDTSQLLDIDRRHLIHPLHHVSDHQAPLLIAEANGPFLYTADGREIIDGLSGLWNVNIGHGRKELAAAAARQMERLAFASAYVGATNASRRSVSPSVSSTSPTRTSRPSTSPRRAPSRTSRRSSSRATTGRLRASRRRRSSSRASTVITASPWRR